MLPNVEGIGILSRLQICAAGITSGPLVPECELRGDPTMSEAFVLTAKIADYERLLQYYMRSVQINRADAEELVRNRVDGIRSMARAKTQLKPKHYEVDVPTTVIRSYYDTAEHA